MHLARFEHLTEFKLCNAKIHLDELDENRLLPIATVRVLSLQDLQLLGPDPMGSNFCCLFSAMFPNLEQLYIKFNSIIQFYQTIPSVHFVPDFQIRYETVLVIQNRYYWDAFDPVHGVVPFLPLFGKLRKHRIQVIKCDNFDQLPVMQA